MDRRHFLGSLPLSAAALHPLTQKPVPGEVSPAAVNTSWPLVPPEVNYFTREKLARQVDTSVSLEGIPFQVVVYNFPSWHPSPYMEKYFGKGWTEFETVVHAKPVFDGHLQPKRPLWGIFRQDDPATFNEADPAWAAREIELASSAGIHAFMIDWYWHMGTMFYHEQLEQGFLRAPNREKVRFAVMWANHNWSNLYPAPEYGKEAALNPQTYSEADMDRLTDYLLEHYFHEPNYWRINDEPVFAIFNIDGEAGILNFFGLEKLRRVLDRMRNRVAKAGLKGLHIQTSYWYTPGRTSLKEAGFDSATRYHTFAKGPMGTTTEYAKGVEKTIALWKDDSAKLDVPYFPDCPVGADSTPRFGKRTPFIYVHRTPDQYELLVLAAKYFVARQRVNPPIIFLSSWNEWTEDHYLLPDEVYGYSYLEAVRRQFGS